MNTPRRGLGLGVGISKGAEKFAGGDTLLAQAASAFTEDLGKAAGEIRVVSVDELHPDPANPRNLGITWEMLKDRTLLPDTRRVEYAQEIDAMAASIKSVGLAHEPVIYRDERGRYVIADGERRYWACRLLEMTSIPCKVLREKPPALRLLQFVTNFQHQQLPLAERLSNLRLAVDEIRGFGGKVDSPAELAGVTGISIASAYRYWPLLSPPKDVTEWIAERIVTDPVLAARLAGIKDPGERTAFLQKHRHQEEDASRGGGDAGTPVAPTQVKKKKRGAGRPANKITLGKVDMDIGRKILESLLPAKLLKGIEWDDPTTAHKAWKEYLNSLHGKGKS